MRETLLNAKADKKWSSLGINLKTIQEVAIENQNISLMQGLLKYMQEKAIV